MKETGLLCNPSQSCPILSDVCQQVWEVPAEVNITSHYITLHFMFVNITLHHITLHVCQQLLGVSAEVNITCSENSSSFRP